MKSLSSFLIIMWKVFLRNVNDDDNDSPALILFGGSKQGRRGEGVHVGSLSTVKKMTIYGSCDLL